MGAIDIGAFVPRTEPPTLLEAEKPKFRFEHGADPGLTDELAELKERLEDRGEWPPPPPKFQTQLRMKLRYAQEGRYWEKVGPGNTGPLGLERSDPSVHQELLWDSVCHQMSDLMDKGCGHLVKDIDVARKEIYDTMKIQDPKRNGRDILQKIEARRREARDEQERSRRKKLESVEADSQDCSSAEERELQQIRRRRLEELRKLERGFAAVLTVTADTFVREVVQAGRVWVVLLVYDHGRQDCEVLGKALATLARKHGNVIKFGQVHYSHVLPDLDVVTELPQLLFYRSGDIKHQVVGLLDLGLVSTGLEGKIAFRKDADFQDPQKKMEVALEKMLDEYKALGPRYTTPAKGAKMGVAALSDDDEVSSSTQSADDSSEGASD